MRYGKIIERKLKKLGARIKYLRKEANLSQFQLAEEININVSYLAKIENGYVNTSIKKLTNISKGLNVKVRDLFEY